MSKLPRMVGTHAAELERWIGKEALERTSENFRHWYGPPVAVTGVPGRVYVCGGGDFRGRIRTGKFASAFDVAEKHWRKAMEAARRAADPSRLNANFTSLSDFIVAYSTPSKRRMYPVFKAGPSGTVASASSLWQSTGGPAAGGAGSAAPGGRQLDDTTAGAFPMINAAGGQTQKYVASALTASVANSSVLLYDRIFDVAKTMSSAATEAVTGTLGRYTSQTQTNDDWCGGNFIFPEVQSALGATAHNWTVCQYTDDTGTTAQSIPSIAGIASAAAQRIDLPLGAWFMPLAAGDFGIKALTQMQCSAVVTGSINFVVGHPIAVMLCPVAGSIQPLESTAYAFERIFDDAAMAMLELPRSSGTACNYGGFFMAACS